MRPAPVPGPGTASNSVANAAPPSVLTLSHEPTHTLATVSSCAERTMVGSSTAQAGAEERERRQP